MALACASRRSAALLLVGVFIGLLWANLAPELHRAFVHLSLLGVDVDYLVNDVGMALFFALAGKEVWAALLPGGALRELRSAASPLCATLGGMAGPAFVYVVGAAALGRLPDLAQGWAIPCATDIAFSAFIARRIFGSAHPALPFLLLVAIADDALGLLILALFYPAEPLQAHWLWVTVAAVLAGIALRRAGATRLWLYLLVAGGLSWTGFALSGLHPALGLLPIIPTLPHETLAELERRAHRPVEIVLGLFGLVNGGVVLASVGAPTWLVLAGLLIGKPCGIFAAGWLAERALGATLPRGMTARDLFVVGCTAAVGFTVALFVSVAAFAPGPDRDAAKMGALLSLAGGVLALVAARLLRVESRKA